MQIMKKIINMQMMNIKVRWNKMTVKELKEELNKYPDDMEVYHGFSVSAYPIIEIEKKKLKSPISRKDEYKKEIVFLNYKEGLRWL